MKKLLISVLAISGLMACTKSDVVEMPQSQAIKFGSAFVDNSTKVVDPSTTMENFTTFKVWGKLTPTGGSSTNIFNGIDVVKDGSGTIGDTWRYAEGDVQYWIPTVKYNFAAIAGTCNVSNNDNMPSTITYDATTQTDLMYAQTDELTGQLSNNETVLFTFSHLLSKVQFEFVNAYPTASNLYIKVTNIKIVNPYFTGTYTINGGSWGTQTLGTNYDLTFGYAGTETVDANNGTVTEVADYIAPNNGSAKSNYARLMIPGVYNSTSKLKISFVATVYLKQGTDTYTEIAALKIDKSSDYVVPTSLTLRNNYSYNFKITLGEGLEPIKFSVSSVNGWDLDNNGTDSDTSDDKPYEEVIQLS